MHRVLLMCSLLMLFGSGVKGQRLPPVPVTETPVVYPGDYIILAPNTIHPGSSLTISVNILKPGAATVTVTANIVKNGLKPPVATATKAFNAGTADTMTLQIPGDASGGSYMLEITGSGGIIFKDSQALTFKSDGFAILVQSDKAIYKPGQTIMFRAMAVDRDLKPFLGMFAIEMKDPDGNVVKQWTDLLNAQFGVVSGEMFMSDEARLGDWIIEVTANGQVFEHVVEVSEYVLPKFEVKLILPPYVTGSDTEFSGMVEAKYTYGKPVKGTATVTLKDPVTRYGATEEASIVRSNIKVTDGTGDFRFTKREIASAFNLEFNENSQYQFELEAEVTESLTSIKQEGAGSTPYKYYPIKVTEVTGNPTAFKPGLPYTAYVSITHVDDSMLTEEERRPGAVFRISQGYDVTKFEDSEHTIPENGIVKFAFDPVANATNYKIQVFYGSYVPEEPRNYCQNCITIDLQPAESPTDRYLQITTSSTDLTTGDTAQFTILSTSIPGTLQYQIVSRGDIVQSSNYEASSIVTQLSFPVTAEMAPSPRLIIYYVESDGEVILASINFKVSGVFKNDVTIAASMDKVEPGQEVSLDISAAANSFIGILAIDQSVRLLKTGNDITQDQILQELDEFDTTPAAGGGGGDVFFGGRRRRRAVNQRSKRSGFWCPWCWFPISGTTVKEVIENAGMLVYTDGLVYGNTQPGWQYDDIAQFRPVAAAGGAYRGGDFDEDAAEDLGNDQQIDNSIGNSAKKSRIRSEFPETWLWSDYVADANGNVRVTSKAPDTITSWVASAFGVSNEFGIGVADPTATIQVFKSFFISLNIPYSVVRGELLALQVTVFNYLATDVTADITLVKSAFFENIKVEKKLGKTNEVGEKEEDKVVYTYESKDQVVSAKIGANEGVTISFPIRPTKLGMIPLNVRATSTVAQDALEQQLLVEAEGVPQSYTKPLFVDLSDTPGGSLTTDFTFDLPTAEEGLVEGSVLGVITATGDIMGPTINGLEKLLQLPSGCGEQNMIYFAPDVFIYKYLTSTNQDNTAIKEKALKFMEIGHSRELEYQHKTSRDAGAFSAFGDSDDRGSTWLTAFVVKSFVQAKPYVYINMPKVEQALTWMLAQKQRDGAFGEPGRVIHTDMQGNVNSDITMTAYVLIALQEVLRTEGISVNTMSAVETASANAVTYLEGRKADIKSDVYVLSLATYALTMANSAIKTELRMALDMEAQGEGGLKYWSRNVGDVTPVNDVEHRGYYQRPPTADVEMTGYALLSYLETGSSADFAEAAGIAKWLTQQRNSFGGYTSTQDTVIGLQALSGYATLLNSVPRNIVVAISATDSASDTQELTINEDNSIVYQQVELSATSGTVTVTVSGTGNCLIQFNVDYNINNENLVDDFDFTVEVTDQNRNRVDVTLCGKYKRDKDEPEPGMGIINMAVFSGFEPMEDELKDNVIRDANIARHETNGQGVTVYINDVGTPTCVTVPLQRTKPVAHIQPAQASIYQYYKAETQVYQMFSSETLLQTEVCDVCGSNCDNCNDIPVAAGTNVIVNSALVMLLTAVTLIAHRFI